MKKEEENAVFWGSFLCVRMCENVMKIFVVVVMFGEFLSRFCFVKIWGNVIQIFVVVIVMFLFILDLCSVC